MRTMQAAVLGARGLSLAEVARPEPQARDDVIVEVAFAGVCRTDLFVADGRLGAKRPLVLGHELAGRLAGSGEPVTVDPRIPCRRCAACARGTRCDAPLMLGVDRDGAFAEALCVPSSSLLRLPPDLPLDVAAYTEPLAATLAVAKSGIRPGQRGLVWGSGRIAELLLQVLEVLGHGPVERYDQSNADALTNDAFDFAIETGLDDKALSHVVRALRPGARLVLKSRTLEGVSFCPVDLVHKELEVKAVSYGSFEQAVELLASGRIDVRPLLGARRPLAELDQVFAEARRGEGKKLLFAIGVR